MRALRGSAAIDEMNNRTVSSKARAPQLSRHEELFAVQVRAYRLDDGMIREYKFAESRKFRFDFAWPTKWVAVEIEGGIWNEGRHTRGAGFAADCEKYNLATIDGWRVLRYTADMVRDGSAIKQVDEVLR